MNVPAPKFLIEKTWQGACLAPNGAEWRSAAGGSLDVLGPATGNNNSSRLTAVAAENYRRSHGAG